ncbi:MAG: PAS domain-containing protein [Sandarakinorhabdus sp.]|nr:PAS domain-containing protein [Sandarakinorhabdus sp.]
MGNGTGRTANPLSFLSGGGEMGALMRSHDWETHELGPAQRWPQSLKTVVHLMLNTGHPLYVWWGNNGFCFYNDAYRQSIGPERHPSSLGRPAAEVWSEIWPIISPQIEQVMANQGATWHENSLVPITRHGQREEVYWTYSYSPIGDDDAPDGVGGVLVICTETTRQVLAERTQASELNRLVRTLEEAPGIMAIFEGPEHVLTFSNAAHRKVTDNRELVGKPLRAAFPDIEGQGYFELFDRVWATGEPVKVQAMPFELQSPSGGKPEQRFVDQLYQPIFDEAGSISGIFLQAIDVTERMRSDEMLCQSEERFRSAIDAVEGILWTNNAAGEMEGEQPGWTALTGQGFADYQGFGWSKAVHPDDAQPTINAWDAAVRERRTFAFSHRLRRHDGQWRQFSIRAVPTFDAEGSITQWVGVHTDITDQRIAEARLSELNETLEFQVQERTSKLRLYRNMIESSAAPSVAFDSQLRVTAFNQAHADAFFDVFGHHAAVGEVLPDLFPPDQAEAMTGLMNRALAGETFSVVEAFGDPNRRKPYFDATYAPLRDEEGRIVGAFHHAQDITNRLNAEAELAKAQDELRQSQKMEAMGQLTGGVAHDFNNLLTPILGSLDMLMRRGIGNDRERRLIDGALQSAERAKTLVQRLLAFARRQPLQPVAVDLTALIDGMAELVASTVGPTITVRADLAENLPPASADLNQLEMAILNLCVNARDAMPEGGTLTIEATRDAVHGEHASGLRHGHYVRLSVTDTGTGMDEATRARAIEPFFSTKGIGKGTGLGLSMVHGLAAQLGGGLTIDSAPGRGTTVALWLPVSLTAFGAVDHTGLKPVIEESRGCVLLVDDEELIRMSTADMLTDMGFEVCEAGSAEEALALLDQDMKIDLIITDHLMPGMSGAQLAYEVRARNPALPILIVSGYADVDGIAPELPRLTKPFRQSELAAKLHELDGQIAVWAGG